MKNSMLVWFDDVDLHSRGNVGKHAEQLARLQQVEFPILPGFVITNDAYMTFLKENKLDYKIQQLLSTTAIERPESLMQTEHHIKKLFDVAVLSEDLEDELINYYTQLRRDEVTLFLYETNPQARKHITALANNETELSLQVKNAWAQMFTAGAIWHRHHHGLHILHTGAEIIVQEEITADTTGTVITVDPLNHEKDKLIILTHEPHADDRYIVSKKNLSIIDRSLKHTTNLPKLSHDEILMIADMAKELEKFLYFPQEISWAIEDTILYILEVKPFSSLPLPQKETKRKLPIAHGLGITKTIGTGVVVVINSSEELRKIKSHDIVVISELEVKHLPRLKKARGVISESHFNHGIAVILKQYGIPAVSNVKEAGKYFHNGRVVTIHGEKGDIYLGGFI